MSMNRNPTSLKKSSGDCLNWQSSDRAFWVKWCYFETTTFSQVVQKH